MSTSFGGIMRVGPFDTSERKSHCELNEARVGTRGGYGPKRRAGRRGATTVGWGGRT